MPAADSAVLPELASVPWRQRTDALAAPLRPHLDGVDGGLHRPFIAAGVLLLAIEPLAAPVALAAFAHAWIIPELYAYRGASVVRPKGRRNEASEPVAQGFLGDLLGHDERELQRRTGLALQSGELGTWLVGEAGRPGEGPPRPLLLRAHHRPRAAALGSGRPPPAGAPGGRGGLRHGGQSRLRRSPWRVRRRLPKPMRPALDGARESPA